MENLLRAWLGSGEPAVRFRVLRDVLGSEPDARAVRRARAAVKSSPRVERLLSERDKDGRIPGHPYGKWRGAHWVLAALADIGYPPGDPDLLPLQEQVLGWLLGKGHRQGIRIVAGKVRRCASQEGNPLHALLTLGLADERTEQLARDLRTWQWPDGGWNCDRRPAARMSSFHESLLPLRALTLHAKMTGDRQSQDAAERAAELFLTRRLFRRRTDGSVISPHFLRLHYPCYWHYDILFGLKVMAEAGRLGDERCAEALDALESRRLPDGGFPAEARYYRVTPGAKTHLSLVDWGKVDRSKSNPFVTTDAWFVLREAGRLTPLGPAAGSPGSSCRGETAARPCRERRPRGSRGRSPR